MIQAQKTMVGLLAAIVAWTGTVGANTADPGRSPYQTIVEKNVFRLKPPPAPQVVVPPPAPMPKITLTGIATFGKKCAMLKTPPPPAKPGEQPQGEQFYTLAVGERDGEMEMLEINEQAGSVKVRYAGTEIALNFVDNGANPGVAAPQQAPGQTTLPPGVGGARPAIPGVRPLPTRTLRLPTPTGTPTGNPVGAYNSSTAGGYAPPGYNAQVTAPSAAQQEPLSPDEQAVLLEAQRQLNPEIPLPPTPLTPAQGQTTPPPQYQGTPRPY